MTQSQFINTLYAPAIEVQRTHGIPALAIMAQSALETGWGSSVPGNMFFGIKAGGSWTGKKQLLWTHEWINGKYVKVQDWFRAYDTPLDSLRDYAEFIHRNNRYAAALKYPTNPEAYIKEIAKAGYATDPNYSSKINAIIEIIKKKSPK